MNIFQKTLKSLQFVSVPKKTLAIAGLLAVALPMSFSAGEAKAAETFRLQSGVALNTNNRFRRIYGNPRMSLWRHNLNDRDQQFTRLRNPDGSYRLQHASTGKCLNAHLKWNGGEVNVWPCNPYDADQKFDFVNVGGGASLIRRRGTNLCVDAPTFANYGRIHLWQCMGGNPHQRWYSNTVPTVDTQPRGRAGRFFNWARGQRGIARLDRSDLRGQCVTLAVRYLQDVYFGGSRTRRAYGHGKDVARGVASQHPNLFRYRTSGVPKPGAIISFRGSGYNYRYGHVGIVIDSRPDGSFTMIDSNSDSRHSASVVKVHSWRSRRGVVGWADPINPLP